MADTSAHINYSFEDIQRYLQGKMPAAEMHAMEKAALQDPFLADAIEGYKDADAATATQHLNEIHAGLFAEKKKSKLVAINRKTRWLRIAAIVIVIAGAGIIASYFYKSNEINDQNQLAKVQQEPTQNQQANDSETSINGSTPLTEKSDSSLLIAENKTSPKTEPALSKRKSLEKNNTISNNILKESDIENQAEVAGIEPSQEKTTMSPSLTPADSLPALRGYASGLAVSPSPATFAGKVVDENNKPVPGVVVESADKKFETSTDLSGGFVLQRNDSVMNVTVSNIGYESQTANLEPGNKNIITLKTNNQALDDVAVTAYKGVTRKAADSTATPVGGWKNFNTYVLNELNKDTTNPAFINPQDLVEIEFLVDKAGNPYDFKVVKSLDKQRNAKAIEIIKTGPKWTNTSKNKKARVAISF